jgi:NitT/TauT family transport system substrate-binding protein
MKRGIAGVLGIAIIATVACGGESAAPTETSPLTAAPSAAAQGALPAPEKTTVKIGRSNDPGATNMTGVIAQTKDFYGKHGLKVEILRFSGAAPAMQALLAGQVDIGDNSAAPVFATVGTPSQVQIVYVTRANMSDILYSHKDIKTADQLRGKTIAISSFGSNSYAGALQALKALGLTERDVTLTTVGNDTQRLAALRGGSVAASIQDRVIEKDLNAQGFNSLVRLREIKDLPGQPGTSLVVPVDFQKKYPNTTLALVAAQMEAQQWFRDHPEEAAAILATAINVDIAEAKRQVTLELEEPWTPKDGRCEPAVMQFAKTVAVAANPALANVDPSQGCTNEFVDRLKTLGFQKKIGIPGY